MTSEIEDSPDIPVTGEPRVDEALRSLGDLGDLPVSEHPSVFEHVHGQLVDVLGELRPAAVDEREAVDGRTAAGDPQP